jgi:molecular chaperone GrpE
VDPLAEAEKKAAALKDQLLRTAADFDNFRKRSRREVDEARQAGRESMLTGFLPVFDNLERATEHVNSASDLQSLSSGIQMVIKQFRDTLQRLGIERINTLGQPFDPNIHEAIQQMVTTDYAPGSVAGEVQGGYRLGDRLIRPAMVVVAKAPEGPLPVNSPEEPDVG